ALYPGAWAHADSAYINYLHHYAESTRMHADRVKIGSRLDSGWGFEGELKNKNAGDRQDVAFDNTVGNGQELTVSYQNPQ
ncbi:oligogalacturonate-specific porin KdgM family protein, partial [Pseudomonas syringae pv. tagetis]|uniref:oligogalacturonate-specific porin KdgM family protein n=1 Tax=Pseudomonas syringae group genomosp. 7 TaxID=251699 RepID=UPI0037705059